MFVDKKWFCDAQGCATMVKSAAFPEGWKYGKGDGVVSHFCSERCAVRLDKVGDFVQGGGVPGGHYCLYGKGARPFVPNMSECNSIALRHSDVVVDIGAYVGTYAIRCARFPVQKVTAYEPTPRSFQAMERNPIPRNLSLRQAAVVGDDRATVELFVSSGIGVTNSIAKTRKKVGAVEVPAVSYVEAVRGASVVKIDIEGGEYELPIIQSSIRALMIDFHPIDGDWKAKVRNFEDEARAAGFETVHAPNFDKGWTPSGSWIRPMETVGEYRPAMKGKQCCGCGADFVRPLGARALCATCYGKWTPKHRAEFICEPEY